jgi:hypothetical protein
MHADGFGAVALPMPCPGFLSAFICGFNIFLLPRPCIPMLYDAGATTDGRDRPGHDVGTERRHNATGLGR